MNFIPSFLKRKKRVLVIHAPATWNIVCQKCDVIYDFTLVEGNPYPLGCPACGRIQQDTGRIPLPPADL